jgi:alpha-glucosidase
MHPEVTEAVTQAIRLRYRLLPYMWQCFEAASQKHEPIIRPTFFNFPNDARCLQDCDDFMLGDALLVAPVVAQGDTQRRVYLPQLPPGESWFDFYTRTPLAAGTEHVVWSPALVRKFLWRMPQPGLCPGSMILSRKRWLSDTH